MRSCALGWLLQYHGGLEAAVLRGGYKAFRNWQHQLYCYLEPDVSPHHLLQSCVFTIA